MSRIAMIDTGPEIEPRPNHVVDSTRKATPSASAYSTFSSPVPQTPSQASDPLVSYPSSSSSHNNYTATYLAVPPMH
jgi:hypothetical protein